LAGCWCCGAVNRNRVLLVKYAERKRRGFYHGKWLCPASVLKFGETLEEGAKREVKEETGFDIRITGQAMTYDGTFVERGRRVHVVFVRLSLHR